jgi:hypothetical protein
MFLQTDLVPSARGFLWDTRQPAPVPLDFDAPLHSHFDTAFLESALRDHPDRELVSHSGLRL